MLITRDGSCAGSLSAGCLEEEVALAAREVIESGQPRLISFDTRRRFGCNGSIEIFVEAVRDDLLGELTRHAAARRACVLETVFEGGALSGTRMIDDEAAATPDAFVQVVHPAIRLLAIGSGPDSAALVAQAQLLDWETDVLESIADWRGAVDEWTAAIVATHNYGRDCAALRHLLPLGLPYLGVIGPRRRRDELLLDVLDAGAVPASKLFAPAGLHLGAETPEQIALSIVAEIQATFANASAVPLSKRRAPIHEAAATSLVAAR